MFILLLCNLNPFMNKFHDRSPYLFKHLDNRHVSKIVDLVVERFSHVISHVIALGVLRESVFDQ